MSADNATKKCTVCDRILPISDFSEKGKKLKSGEPARRGDCKSCYKEKAKAKRDVQKAQAAAAAAVEENVVREMQAILDELITAVGNDNAIGAEELTERLNRLSKIRQVEKAANVNNSFNINNNQLHSPPGLNKEQTTVFIKQQILSVCVGRLNKIYAADSIHAIPRSDGSHTVVMLTANLNAHEIGIIINNL
jgi:uncharacterized protein YlaI